MPKGIYKRIHNTSGNLGIYSKKGAPKPVNAYKWEKGEKHFAWKGNGASIGSMHDWVCRYLGKPDTCEHCGKSGLTGYKIHWANIDHAYKRVLDDYIRLCASCHRKYDYKNNLKPGNKIGNNQFKKLL